MTAPVLIAGGYGVVGAQVARLVRERHPNLPLLIGGRNPDNGRSLADELENTRAIALDVSVSDPLARLGERPGAVVVAVNDLGDRLLAGAVDAGVPLVDITRWTSLVHRALARLAVARPAAPVMLASGWMAGTAPLLAAWAADDLGAPRTVDISIRYSMTDRAGPDSVEYVDRLAERYEATIEGRQQLVDALSDGRRVEFADGSAGSVYRLDTPEQLTLPVTLGAATATTRIGFESAATTKALVALRRLGLLRLLSRPRFEKVRRGLLYNPGDGGVAQVRIDVAGSARSATVQVRDPAGQSHLTATGAVVALERVLGIDGSAPEPAGIRFPEQHPAPDTAVATLRWAGVEVERRSGPALRT